MSTAGALEYSTSEAGPTQTREPRLSNISVSKIFFLYRDLLVASVGADNYSGKRMRPLLSNGNTPYTR